MNLPMNDKYAFRELLLDRLRRDLVGPTSEHEEITDAPVTRYAVGVLFPQDAGLLDAELDVDTADDNDESAFGDPPVAMANTRYPSSMGMTFAVDLSHTRAIHVHPGAARYEPDGDPVSALLWRRVPCEIEPVRIAADQPATGKHDLGSSLELYYRVRAADTNQGVSITIALVNRRSGTWPRDPDCFFQPELVVRGEGDAKCFIERQPAGVWTDDEELASYRLLYRHARNFATGHGCATDWPDVPDATHLAELRTAAVPAFALRLADSNPDIPTDTLGMHSLGVSPRETVLAGLDDLCAGYEEWIAGCRRRAAELDQDLADIADRHIADCTTAFERMRRGVEVLRSDQRAWQSFALANRAMHLQRARTTWHERGAAPGGPDLTEDHFWRPFQLAFILLCLPGVVDEYDEHRETADLLWFPTGGGKTEAYLGLIALTLFHRRLRDGPTGIGVGVFMRYTLRLLTIQQFERAALLICCCEQLRGETPELGDDSFLIGLWVGRGGTPNSMGEAAKAIDLLRNGEEVVEGNPVQVHRCPWCGARLSVYDYRVDVRATRLRVRCPTGLQDAAICPFGEALPVVLVDDELYDRRPSLMIATADKFAALPWRPTTGRIFGIGTTSRPPELIIQDELHLISGPLGTLAGLYETAVDFLCTHHGQRPKVIASTATIRRADRQTMALFARQMQQFPPPGIDARDSYFAVESPADTKATRMYVGVMAPGISQTTLMVRTYAALLQHTAELTAPADVKDPYWTLVGYFNSLRVLGGARMQVQDDVSDRLVLLAGDEGTPRPIDQRIELTSRESSADIPGHLEHMKVRHPDDEALDVILATNMISVGVDIDRLGLMVVMGQPQSTSEYIQSTSRVGRRHPGLVVTLYNSARSRDRSHYESFRGYHSALYRQVESTSVTPFSARARDRGLHAVVVALARLTAGGLSTNKDAANIDAHLATIDVLEQKILERVAAVGESEELAATKAQLGEIVALWRRRAHENPNLVFSQPFKPDTALMVDAARGSFDEGFFPTLWSLRDVDLESNLYLVS
jgi:hypothetical protein